eukprot:scaffold88672_cov63-Phaeocystis_antarctica.AAC.2
MSSQLRPPSQSAGVAVAPGNLRGVARCGVITRVGARPQAGGGLKRHLQCSHRRHRSTKMVCTD